MNLTDKEKALVMGSCLEVAVVTLFPKHCYKFSQHLYLQQGGGPTGLSTTGPGILPQVQNTLP